MTTYVSAQPYMRGGSLAYHLWADDETEALLFMVRIGANLATAYPHPTDWPRYALDVGQWSDAIMAGALMADTWAPAEFVALRQGDFVRLAHVQRMRAQALRACAT